MNGSVHFAGISGSLRRKSYNTMLLKAASQLLPPDASMEIISIADLPLYNADLDTPASPQRPTLVEVFRSMLSKADGIVIASPEYNYTIPGGLKNAIDWASRGEDSPLLGKPIALMGASQSLWGTTRMQMHFQALFLYLNMKPVLKPEVLIAQAQKKFNADGDLTDESSREFVREKLEGLKEMVLQVKMAETH